MPNSDRITLTVFDARTNTTAAQTPAKNSPFAHKQASHPGSDHTNDTENNGRKEDADGQILNSRNSPYTARALMRTPFLLGTVNVPVNRLLNQGSTPVKGGTPILTRGAELTEGVVSVTLIDGVSSVGKLCVRVEIV
jgi:hypothetical protein